MFKSEYTPNPISHDTKLRFYEIEIYFALQHIEEMTKQVYDYAYAKHTLEVFEKITGIQNEYYRDFLTQPQRLRPTIKELVHYFLYHGYSYNKIVALSGISTVSIMKYKTETIELLPVLRNSLWEVTPMERNWEKLRNYITIFKETRLVKKGKQRKKKL